MKEFQPQVTEFEAGLLEELSSPEPLKQVVAVRNIKNTVIGIKSKKSTFISLGLVPRLLELMTRDDASVELATEGAAILGSLARGTSEDLKVLLGTQILSILCRGICQDNKKLSLSCLRSLRAYFVTGEISPDIIYDDPNVVSYLVQLLTQSPVEAECSANILFRCCKTLSHQSMLSDAGIIPALAPWLKFERPTVLLPILHCFSTLVMDNEVLATRVSETQYNGNTLKELLIGLLSRDKPDDIQLAAGKCVANFYRAGAIPATDEVIHSKVLSMFVRMCAKDKPYSVRVAAALGLAFLIEEDCHLQQLASISNHLIQNIANFLIPNEEADEETIQNLKEGAFKVFAAISANDEKIRKRVVDCTDKLVQSLFAAVESQNIQLQLGALQCLLSLSRSVQQLRSTFQDITVWQPIVDVLRTSLSDDVISVASSVLCNLLLDISPCKEGMTEGGILEILIALTRRYERPLRLNGIWGLMNLSYEAEDKMKNKILEEVGLPHIMNLLNDPDVNITIKTIGLLRNLLSGKEHVDIMMKSFGSQIMQSVKPLIDWDNASNEIREQTLCLLWNIANGKTAKDDIMADDDLLKKIIEYTLHERYEIQLAAVSCILNLAWNSEDGALERQTKLRDLGAQKQLQALLTTPNVNLFDKVKVALQQFS